MRSAPRNRVAASCLAALLAAGCIGEPTRPNLDMRVSGAVEGQITDPDGIGVVGPLVSVSLLSAPENGTSRLLQQGAFVADDNGRFVVVFVVDNEVPQTAVLLINGTPPPGRGLAPRDSLGLPVMLTRSLPPRDTSYIELRLPAR